ncbi:fumarylacetoacetate hydrolase family protein [Halobacillus andaensis]|uniref:fumarylacetoacetate hydrolase family protein n=1 Tax=Halobacillus andaensis TaxID=1176239 RepID=UPI003D730F33
MNIKVRARVNGNYYDQFLPAALKEGGIDAEESMIHSWASPVCGTVYGTLLNDLQSLKAMGDLLNKPPYEQPPKAPVLYIKPINTITGHHTEVIIPEEAAQLKVGASVGIVIGKRTAKVKAEDAYEFIEGYTLVNDLSLPHASIFRPAIKEKARDGFCPIGPWVVPQKYIPNPEKIKISVYINGEKKHHYSLEQLVRPISQLLQDVSEFMTLDQGDLLMAGCGANLPTAESGDIVRIEAAEIGALENKLRRWRT